MLVLEAVAGRAEGRAVAGHPAQREDGIVVCLRREGLAFAMKKIKPRTIIANRI